MKKFLVIILVVIGFDTYSQNGKIYFLKNNGKYVNNKDSADFMRVVDEPDSGSVNYKITEFYPNSVRKLIGSASVYWPKMIWEGPSVTFDKQGRKVQQITYQNSSPVGSAYYYYPNGRVMKELDYAPVKTSPGEKNNAGLKYRLVNYYDSTGVQLVKDGNGYLKETPNKRITEEGNYADGVRHGIWKGKIVEEGANFEEKYDKGIFISGKAFTSNGKLVEYTIKEKRPEFPGEEKAFRKFLTENIKYPEEARSWGMAGKVILAYDVEKDGVITNIQVISSPHYALQEEAIRVLKRSPKWQPGLQNGIPVKVRYTLPVNFSISSPLINPTQIIKF